MPTVLELYETLKPRLGEEEARWLVEFIEGSVERGAATKEDLLRTETTLREEIARVEGKLREEIAQVQGNLREEIHNARADLIKWSFPFWVGNIAVLSAIMFALLRAYPSRWFPAGGSEATG
ncbi:MAG: hypothetical protein ACPL88_09440 [Bryobacteraceae bacterium]